MNQGTWLAVADAVCHRLPERSLTPDSLLCARCTGLYFGLLAVTVVLLVSRGRRGAELPARPFLLGALLSLVPLVVDGLLTEQLYPGALWLRWGTGLLAGAGLALLVLPLVNGLRQRPERRAPVASWGEWANAYGVLPPLFLLGLMPVGPVPDLLGWGALLGLFWLYLGLNAVALDVLLPGGSRPPMEPAPLAEVDPALRPATDEAAPTAPAVLPSSAAAEVGRAPRGAGAEAGTHPDPATAVLRGRGSSGTARFWLHQLRTSVLLAGAGTLTGLELALVTWLQLG